MAAPKKRIKLEEMKTCLGVYFREEERDETGQTILEARKDADGKAIMQVPRDPKTGEAKPNVQPELVYQARTHAVKKPLPMLLRRLYLRIPNDRFVRQDTIYGGRLYQNIADSTDTLLELDEDVYSWIMEKLRDKEKLDGDGNVERQGIGLGVFGADLYFVEKAMENLVDREGEPKKKAGGD